MWLSSKRDDGRYFDTQAIRYFDEPSEWNTNFLAEPAIELRQLVDGGDLSVFLSYPLLEEVLGLLSLNAQKCFRELGFLLDASASYSCRSATVGSTRVACHAGIYVATTPTKITTAITAVTVAGS